MKTQKVKSITFQNSFNTSHRKENHFLQEFAAFVNTKEGLRNCATVRVYGTNAKNYACLWYNDSRRWASGTGSAGGYGYHRPSAAVAEAFENSGVKLLNDISGRGDEAIREALEALAKKLYPRRKTFIHVAHA